MNYVKGDLLSVKHGIIIHGCNAQGVQGAGVAKVIRAKYPDVYTNYKQDIDMGLVGLGEVSWCHLYVGTEEKRNLHIASAITQEFYGNDGMRYVSYSAVADCMDQIFSAAIEWGVNSVALPFIGCGLGGGDWDVIEAIILSAANKCKYERKFITVYEL